MSNSNKGRGRPKGSEKDDSKVLAAVADLILANSKLRPTTAMRRIKPKAADADIRRWQAKWKERREGLLSEAQVRADSARRHNEELATGGKVGLAAMGGLLDTPVMRAACGISRSPAMKVLEAYHSSPAMRAMREIENNPTMRMMRELRDSPTMRLLRQMENSPAVRIAREHQKLMDKLKGIGFL